MALRLFSAIDVPDDVAVRLVALQRGVPGAKWRPRENMHVTLRFFGEVQEPMADDLDAALEEVALGFGAFDLAVRGAGWFGKDEPHALWMGLTESDALRSLAASCEKAARRVGLKPEARKFTPHVTMAALGGAPTLDRVQAFVQRYALFESDPWRVDFFTVKSSWLRPGAPSQFREEAAYPLLK